MTRCYVLVQNHEQGLALHDILDAEGIENRIAPTPASSREQVGCGMCVMLSPEYLDSARDCFKRQGAVFHDIVCLDNQLQSRRDRYC